MNFKKTSRTVPNLMVLGEFNIHINDTNDTDAQKFKDSTEAVGMEQHVDTSTTNGVIFLIISIC